MTESILLVASILGALATIVGTAYKLMKMFHNVMKEIEDVNKQVRDNALHILKLAILEENMPPAERMKCGERYVALGGNGQIKKIYQDLIIETERMTAALKQQQYQQQQNISNQLKQLSNEDMEKLLEILKQNKE